MQSWYAAGAAVATSAPGGHAGNFIINAGTGSDHSVPQSIISWDVTFLYKTTVSIHVCYMYCVRISIIVKHLYKYI